MSRDVVVALLTERSPEMVLGALAVLQAGGAYLPLDPAHPEERLAEMLRDAEAAVLLTRGELGRSLAHTPIPVVRIDRLWPEAPGGEDLFDLPYDPDDLAYVIYTSGSTGRPKGVELHHGGLVNLAVLHQALYGVTEADRGPVVSGPAFDASVWDVWPYLSAGASLHVPDFEARSAPEHLLAWFARVGITQCFLPTPLGEAILRQEMPSGLAMRFLLTGGDRLSRTPERELPFVLVNHYGPTEYTTITTGARMSPGLENPPIGGPLANTRVYVVGLGGDPVPVRVPGELQISGVGLARGYLRRPALTAERFIPDPVSASPGGRLYRTGDLVRWQGGAEAQLDFVGRIDHQVQVHGVRVELGEIEAALLATDWVSAAVVVARGDAGAPRLVAYVILDEAPVDEPWREALRRKLTRRLPRKMIPSVYVELDALPLNPNGKVDRRALPEPPAELAGGRLEPPRTLTEELIAGIWSEVLGVHRVGEPTVSSSWAVTPWWPPEWSRGCATPWPWNCPLAELFEASSLEELASVVEVRRRRGAAGPPPLTPAGVTQGGQSLSFAQERLWFLDQLEPGSPLYNVPVAIRLEGQLAAAALGQALAGVVRRHASLRTTFHAASGRPVQVVAEASSVPVPLGIADLSVLGPERCQAEVLRQLREVSTTPFDLGAGPLLRAHLFCLSETEHVLLLTLHHIVSDGASMAVLVDELTQLYAAGGSPAKLPDLPVQYTDFAVWQRRWLEGDGTESGALETQLDYCVASWPGCRLWSWPPTGRARPARATVGPAASGCCPRGCGAGWRSWPAAGRSRRSWSC